MPKIKFNHHELLPNDLTLVINGRRNAGKTTLLFKLLTTPGVLDYNNLMFYTQTDQQHLCKFLKHGFENNLNKQAINNLCNLYEHDDDFDTDNIEGLCKTLATKYPMTIERDHPITFQISSNINDFELRSLDRTKKNLIVFDDCSSNKDQHIQTTFFQNGRHYSCACIYLTHRFY